MAKEDKNNTFAMMTLVAIVAVVGIVGFSMMILNNSSTHGTMENLMTEDSNIAGQARARSERIYPTHGGRGSEVNLQQIKVMNNIIDNSGLDYIQANCLIKNGIATTEMSNTQIENITKLCSISEKENMDEIIAYASNCWGCSPLDCDGYDCIQVTK